MIKKNIGIIGLLIVAIIWGSGFVASEIALRTMSPLKILCLRFLIGAVLMTIFGARSIKRAGKKTIAAGIILGILLYLAFAMQTIGLKYTTPSKNAFLTATNVVIVPFIALILYKKKVDRYSIAGAVLAIIGIGILSLKSDFTLSLGDGLTLVCAVCFAFHIFFTGEFVKKHDYMALTALQMIVAFLLATVVLLISGDIRFNFERSGLLSVLYLGIFSTTIAFFLQTLSQKYTDETKAAIILSMESVFGTLFSIIIVGENVTMRMAAGCILILAAVITAETKLKFLIHKRS